MRFSATSVDTSEFSEDIAISNSEKHLILETVRLFEKLARYDDLDIRENGPKGQNLIGWRGQVTRVEAWIRSQCRPKYDLNSDDGYLSYQRACVATKKRIFKGLEKVDDSFFTDPALRGRVDSIIEFFKINLNQVFATDQNNVNGNYRQRVSIRSNDDNRIQCDPSEYVKKAHSLLSMEEGPEALCPELLQEAYPVG